jgi:hypothetical protein
MGRGPWSSEAWFILGTEACWDYAKSDAVLIMADDQKETPVIRGDAFQVPAMESFGFQDRAKADAAMRPSKKLAHVSGRAPEQDKIPDDETFPRRH